MLSEIDIFNVLFLDIETVPQEQKFDDLTDHMQELWEKKSSFFRTEDQSAVDVYPRSGIYAEFGKIICISVGLLVQKNDFPEYRLKSYSGSNEKELLQSFRDMLEAYTSGKRIFLCAHNGKEFDFPYIARRMLINGISLPQILDTAGRKPWEVTHIDTLELWKFGDYKHYTSLDLLTTIFNIPTPKSDIDGSQVAEVYYKEKDLPRIVEYCQKDVIAIIQLLLRYKGLPLIVGEGANISVEYFND